MQGVTIRDDFGVAIKAARQSMGMTQRQLAEKLCITPRYLKTIENSGRMPSYDLFVKTIKELEIRVDFVIYPKNNEPSSKIYMLHDKGRLDRNA